MPCQRSSLLTTNGEETSASQQRLALKLSDAQHVTGISGFENGEIIRHKSLNIAFSHQSMWNDAREKLEGRQGDALGSLFDPDEEDLPHEVA